MLTSGLDSGRSSLRRFTLALRHWINHSQWVVPVGFLAFIFLFVPFWKAFLYNFDEGFELMRATMQNEGFVLYKDIWSDQPPLFSSILRFWLSIFGNSIFLARLLIVLFATSLLFFFYKTLRLFLDHWSAVFGIALLIFTSDFIKLAVQVKVDMPALALVTAMLYYLMASLHHDEKPGFATAAIAGCFMGLALQAKLYTILVTPAIALYFLILLIQSWRQTQQRTTVFLKAALFGGGIISSILLAVLFYREATFGQLVQSHLEAKQHFEELTFKTLVVDSFKDNPSFWIFSSLGLGFLLTKERWRIVFPTGWLMVTLIVLSTHSPLWPHYYLLFALPAVWIGSCVFFQVRRSLTHSGAKPLLLSRGWRESTLLVRLGIVAILLVLGIHILGSASVYARGRHQLQQAAIARTSKHIALDHVLTYGDKTNWLVTDSPIYAFYAGLKVPPELVVISRKRVLTDGLDGGFILQMIHKYQPEQVLLERFVEKRFDPPFLAHQPLAAYLNEHYVELTGDDGNSFPINHFVLKSIAHPSPS